MQPCNSHVGKRALKRILRLRVARTRKNARGRMRVCRAFVFTLGLLCARADLTWTKSKSQTPNGITLRARGLDASG